MGQLVTFVGNAAANPELSYSDGGVARVRLALVCQDRYRDASGVWQDGQPHTVFVTAFRDSAERIGESVNKGDRLIVTGSFTSRQVTAEDGTSRWFTDFIADEVGLSCRWALVSARKVTGSAPRPAPSDDAWASAPADKVPASV